ncbi:uncharacterized protein PGTG_14682 [Puccinia graminis f. sp. tritici CRL 75-36-700-3]|uniref:Uncharacterized protein n=1 Tax=Puccinia graminis f. sp. tritici (strain CRL 75-36-700-3 / race SCCL) TaxID=418459 RepID=E3KWP9_PUCGT|nr:uncharacterized protein PGTG_14682 [Puccinia graminis f. sp. tritici CRL 75-36-700-3]EFP88716.2 hypothetical protein PGTG_14682 [Puccinia graminis f. sp. tritici CRL 75-36-700-3]
MSQGTNVVQASELDTDDPRLPDCQAKEHAEHARMAFSHPRKQLANKSKSQAGKKTSEELAILINENASHIKVQKEMPGNSWKLPDEKSQTHGESKLSPVL